jgi:hypothetical protein
MEKVEEFIGCHWQNHTAHLFMAWRHGYCI